MIRALLIWTFGSIPAALIAGMLLRAAGEARDRREQRMFDGARR